MEDIIKNLHSVVMDRKIEPQEGSYTCYLFEKGEDKILKKIGEECAETIIAAKNGDKNEIVMESCDLIYHLLVLFVEKGVEIADVLAELEKRSNKIGNLKTMRDTDKNT